MLLLVDNYDSFTYNLVQYFQILQVDVRVIRNDARIDFLENADTKFLVVSPGPGSPLQAGISIDLIAKYAPSIPILGICLGHQCIAKLYGAKVIRATQPLHGKTSAIFHDGKGVFADVPQGFSATRYHSLIVDRDSLPAELVVSAETKNGEIMGLRHVNLPIEGVQFHPESVKTEHGLSMLNNFITHRR
jgi:anthranilate synthase/aminodeoxychorismate synthase-like glutamine amidotransferase